MLQELCIVAYGEEDAAGTPAELVAERVVAALGGWQASTVRNERFHLPALGVHLVNRAHGVQVVDSCYHVGEPGVCAGVSSRMPLQKESAGLLFGGFLKEPLKPNSPSPTLYIHSSTITNEMILLSKYGMDVGLLRVQPPTITTNAMDYTPGSRPISFMTTMPAALALAQQKRYVIFKPASKILPHLNGPALGIMI